MEGNIQNIEKLLADNEELKYQLSEANGIIEAIREGAVDALVLNTNGRANLYSLETADYTYRLLIEKFGEGALSISEKGVILYCNEYFSNLIGIPANKITGSFFNSYVDSPGQFKALTDKLSSGLSKGEIILNIEGKKIPVYVSLTNLQPHLPAIGIIVTDLSEKRKHEEALEIYQQQLEIKNRELNRTNTQLEQFIHVISHDIKEPIRKIVTYSTHLMETGAASDEKVINANLEIINNSAKRLNSLVDDLVHYSLASSKALPVEVDLNEIVAEVIDDLELVVAENKAAITFQQLPKINGFAVQMRQLFSNLLANALKYKKENAKPVIRIVSEITDCVDLNFPNKKFHRISVADNGIGMDKDGLHKIFTIFQRLHMPGEYSGNGIGLAICKKIMENHSGKIEAESIPGKGSTFNLYLPVNL